MKFVFLSSFAHLVLDETESRVSGGAELQVALLSKELASKGHEVTLIGGDTGQKDGVVFSGVKIRNGGRFHTGRTLEMLGAVPRVFAVLREEKPDWVGLLGWTSWLFLVWLGRFLYQYRLLFICGLDTEVNGEFRRDNPVRGGLFEFAMRRCDQRFAMTLLQKSHFEKAGMPCALYRNLILPRAFPVSGEKTVDFLWVARCREIKRPELFLQMAREIPEATFEMICPPEDGVLFEKLEKEAKQISNLTLIPSVPYHQIQKHYDRAKIFVNTSLWEGWANSFIQAGQGCCAIFSLSVNPDTLFRDYALGVCGAGDFGAFVARARETVNSPEICRGMGAEAERFVQEMHDNSLETEAFLRGIDEATPRSREG